MILLYSGRRSGIVTVLIILCISLVYGFDRRWLCSVLGALGGVVSTIILGLIFTNLFKIHGAVMSNSESLLYSGYQSLNLTRIFVAGTILGASGSFIDLSVNISSAIAGGLLLAGKNPSPKDLH